MSAHSDCADKTRNKHAPYIESDGFFLDEGRSVRKKECGDMEIIKRILPMYRCSLRLGFALAAGVVVAASVADARIVRLEILSVQSPTFGGMSFETVGTYEKIFARAYGEVDPTDRRNALITDINLAPRN